MSELITSARAPSNIALVKYMGKKDVPGNFPENPSISLTLDSLCSVAEIRTTPGSSWEINPEINPEIKWIPELPRSDLSLRLPKLNDADILKVTRHIERVLAATPAILARHGITPHQPGPRQYFLRSANTFPAASGIASSASSFAAITLAAAATVAKDLHAFKLAYAKESEFKREMAALSRQGSGSSCRSFEGPWVLWENDSTRVLHSRLPDLAHFVIVISEHPKSVSSSEAHRLSKTSPLWAGRPSRAATRVTQAKTALESGDFAALSQLAWHDAWEMHSLFHTAEPPFSYWAPGTIEVLQWFNAHRSSAPENFTENAIVTLDAGPNVHVSVDAAQAPIWKARLSRQFGNYPLLEDRSGRGAQLLEEKA